LESKQHYVMWQNERLCFKSYVILFALHATENLHCSTFFKRTVSIKVEILEYLLQLPINFQYHPQDQVQFAVFSHWFDCAVHGAWYLRHFMYTIHAANSLVWICKLVLWHFLWFLQLCFVEGWLVGSCVCLSLMMLCLVIFLAF